MAPHSQNLYLSYKHDTNLLVYWIIRKSNRIIQSLPDGDPSRVPLNATG